MQSVITGDLESGWHCAWSVSRLLVGDVQMSLEFWERLSVKVASGLRGTGWITWGRFQMN